MQGAQISVTSGDMTEAIELLNKLLKVESERDVPDTLNDHDILLLLERATLLQSKGNYAMSARDMVAVDQRLEGLDITHSNAKELAKYFYSASATDYRAPPYERLLLNTLNMINFLAQNDTEGARVEARRFTIMEQFYLDKEGKPLLPGLLALGNYISGAAFEASREYALAARYYSRAWHFGIRFEDLRARLIDLYRISNYTGRELDNPALELIREEAKNQGSMTFSEYVLRHQTGDTLVIVQYGMVPFKRATRVPASRALTSSSSLRGSYALDGSTRARALELVASGALNWIMLPELTTLGLPLRTSVSAKLRIDGKAIPLHLGMEVSRQVQTAWLAIAGPVLAAAITRMITRAIIGQAGQLSHEVAKNKSKNKKTKLIATLGWLTSMGAQAALSAADTPDTRSWTTLPAYIRIGRIKLSRGLHMADLLVEGRGDRRTLPVWPDRLNILNLSRIR